MIDPIAFSIFGLDIRWYGVSYALGFFLTYLYIIYFSKLFKYNKEEMEDTFFYFMIFSVLGGRVFEIIFYDLSYYVANPIKVFYVWQGGMSIHGGIFLGAISLWYFSKKYKFDYYKILDLYVVPAALALSIGRLANFVNQELVGKVTNSSLGVVFPLHDDNVRWPTTIFESAKNLVTFQVLLYLKFFKSLKPGLITAWFLILYNLGRFFIDFLREPDVLIGFISMGQLLCLVYGLFGVWMLFRINKNS